MRELEEQVRELRHELVYLFISNFGIFFLFFFFKDDKKLLSYSVISVAVYIAKFKLELMTGTVRFGPLSFVFVQFSGLPFPHTITLLHL